MTRTISPPHQYINYFPSAPNQNFVDIRTLDFSYSYPNLISSLVSLFISPTANISIISRSDE